MSVDRGTGDPQRIAGARQVASGKKAAQGSMMGTGSESGVTLGSAVTTTPTARCAAIRGELMTEQGMPMLATACPSCGTKYQIKSAAIGHEAKCRKCGTAFIMAAYVPTGPEEPLASPVATRIANRTTSSASGKSSARYKYLRAGAIAMGVALIAVPLVLSLTPSEAERAREREFVRFLDHLEESCKLISSATNESTAKRIKPRLGELSSELHKGRRNLQPQHLELAHLRRKYADRIQSIRNDVTHLTVKMATGEAGDLHNDIFTVFFWASDSKLDGDSDLPTGKSPIND